MTGVIWNTDKYYGTPLELQDSRLGNLATWVQHHNITVVKVATIIILHYVPQKFYFALIRLYKGSP